MNVDNVLRRVRSLVEDIGDAEGDNVDFCTTEYVLPLMNQANDELFNELDEMDFAFDENNVELDVVTAGTTDLTAYSTTGKPLELLQLPMWMKWKKAGDDPANYEPVKFRDNLPTQIAVDQRVPYWKFENMVISIFPASIDVDLLIHGKFLPTALKEGDDPTLSGVGFIIALKTVELIAIVRGYEKWELSYGKRCDKHIAILQSRWAKNDQGKGRRFGRTMRPRGSGMGWPRLQQP